MEPGRCSRGGLGMKLFRPIDPPPWLDKVLQSIERAFARVESMPSYTVAEAPDATALPRGWIYVSNEAGGAVPAFSDGTNWRRVTDRAVIS